MSINENIQSITSPAKKAPLNENFELLKDNDIILQNADADLQQQLTEILNETDLDPNKDPEVTNARNSEKNGTFATVKERLDYAEDFDNSGLYADLPTYYGNTKILSDFQDESIFEQGLATNDTTNKKLGKQSIRITETDNTGGFISDNVNNVSFDFTKLNNGESSDDFDFVFILLYLSSIDLVADGFNIDLSLSNDSVFSVTNRKGYSINKTDLATGWNQLTIRKDAFYTQGTGSFDNIQSYRISTTTASNQQGEYFSFQLVQLIKKDPLSNTANPLQRFGERDFEIINSDIFVGYEFDEIVMRTLDPPTLIPSVLSEKTYENFTIYAKLKCINVFSDTNRVEWYVDGSNRISILIFDNNIRVEDRDNGFTNIKEKPFAFSENDTVEFTVSKEGQSVSIIANKNYGELIEVFNITTDISLGSSGRFGISLVNDRTTNIESLSISEIRHAHHSDISEVAKEARSINGDVPPRRNYLINGNFDVWQRGTSFLSGGFTADRWSASNPMAVNRVSNTAPINSKYNLELVVDSSPSDFKQIIETSGKVFEDKLIYVSFWCKSSAETTLTISIRKFNQNITITAKDYDVKSVWKKFEFSFDAGIGWQADEPLEIRLTNANNTENKTITYAQVKLEIGSYATPFIPKTYAEELRDCQRYYYVIKRGSATSSAVASGWAKTSTTLNIPLTLPVEMRVNPSIVLEALAGGSIRAHGQGTNIALSGGSYTVQKTGTNTIAVNITGLSGIVTDNLYSLVLANYALNFDAEI